MSDGLTSYQGEYPESGLWILMYSFCPHWHELFVMPCKMLALLLNSAPITKGVPWMKNQPVIAGGLIQEI